MGLKLSDVSPIASLVKGEGIMEYAGVLPAYLTEKRKKKKARKEEEIRKKGEKYYIIGIFSRIFASLPASSSES